MKNDLHCKIMKEISDQKIIEDALNSDHSKLNKDFQINKSNQHIKEKIIDGISNIIKNSVDVQFHSPTSKNNISMRKVVDKLRFSSFDSESKGSLKEMEFRFSRGLRSSRGMTQAEKIKEEDHEINQQEILKDPFSFESNAKKIHHLNVTLSNEPNQDFLLNSDEAQIKTQPYDHENIMMFNQSKQNLENEEIKMSDYYDNVFNSFLVYTNSHLKNQNNSKVYEMNMPSKTSNKKIDISSGLSDYLKSKLDSFIDDFNKETTFKRGTVESFIKSYDNKNPEMDFLSNENKNEMNIHNYKERIILSDLEPILERDSEKIHEYQKSKNNF